MIPHLTVAESEEQELLDRIAADVEASLPVRTRVHEATLIVEDEDAAAGASTAGCRSQPAQHEGPFRPGHRACPPRRLWRERQRHGRPRRRRHDTQQQLDAVVAHFRTEAQREGRAFPKEGTTAFEHSRNDLLRLLVYRLQIEQAASRLGVKVDPNEVTQRL